MTTSSRNGRDGRRRAGLLTVTAIAVLLAGCGDDAPATLNGADVEDQVIDALEELGIEADVICPRDVEIDAGDEFTCEVEPDEGDDFEVDVVQSDDEGSVEFALPFVRLDRTDVESVVANGLEDEVDDGGLAADCSEDFEDGDATFEDGDDFTCVLTGEDGVTAEAQVIVDTGAEEGFTFELSGEPVQPTTTTSTTTTTTTTTTTVPPTLPPATLPPVTLPPNTDDTVEDTIDTTPITDPPSESVFVDSFDDNVNGWLVTDTPGLKTEVSASGTYDWVVDPNPDLDPLPFQAIPEAILPQALDLDDVDVLVDVSFLADGMGGVTCMSTDAGAYVFAVGSNRVYIGKIQFDGTLVELISEPFEVDASVDSVTVKASCFPTDDGGMQLNLDVDEEEVIGFEDLDIPLFDGSAGIYLDFDEEIPQDERVVSTFVFDNFEVLLF